MFSLLSVTWLKLIRISFWCLVQGLRISLINDFRYMYDGGVTLSEPDKSSAQPFSGSIISPYVTYLLCFSSRNTAMEPFSARLLVSTGPHRKVATEANKKQLEHIGLQISGPFGEGLRPPGLWGWGLQLQAFGGQEGNRPPGLGGEELQVSRPLAGEAANLSTRAAFKPLVGKPALRSSSLSLMTVRLAMFCGRALFTRHCSTNSVVRPRSLSSIVALAVVLATILLHASSALGHVVGGSVSGSSASMRRVFFRTLLEWVCLSHSGFQAGRVGTWRSLNFGPAKNSNDQITEPIHWLSGRTSA